MIRYCLIALVSLGALQGALQANEADAPEKITAVAAQEKPVLLLYYKTRCPYCHVVLDYLQEIHRSIPTMNLDNNPKGIAALKKVGGLMQVPCLIIDGKPLYESSAIVAWLQDHKDLLD